MTWTSIRLAWAYVLVLAALPSELAGQRASESLPLGPHSVGYRLYPLRDYQRTVRPRRDFQGNTIAGEVAAPLQISVWYPAAAPGTPLSVGRYHAISANPEKLEPTDESDVAAARDNLINLYRFGLNTVLGPSEAATALSRPAHATENAAPAAGRFALVVGGLEGPGGAYGLAEYLASHGFVVVSAPSTRATRTAQANQPAVALDMQAHRMEAVFAFARALPFADTTRLALIGSNFDGLAALLVQLRNMHADAIVTIDGWENKNALAGAVRASPYLNPLRFRVPYLTFQQDDAPSHIQPDTMLFDEWKYADRSYFILEGLGHLHLLQYGLDLPHTAAQRAGYAFFYGRIKDFLLAHMQGDTAALRRVRQPAPATLVAFQKSTQALPALPIPSELEPIAMRGDVARIRELFRAARSRDASVTLFTRSMLELFAFRFWQRGERERALEFYQLSVETFPASAQAHARLGDAYRELNQRDSAVASYRRALATLDADHEVPASEKAAFRAGVRQKID